MVGAVFRAGDILPEPVSDSWVHHPAVHAPEFQGAFVGHGLAATRAVGNTCPFFHLSAIRTDALANVEPVAQGWAVARDAAGGVFGGHGSPELF